MSGYLSLLHFGLEFLCFLMCFAISHVSWQLYLRNRRLAMVFYSFGFLLLGISGVIHAFNLNDMSWSQVSMIWCKLTGYLLILLAFQRYDLNQLRNSRTNHVLYPVSGISLFSNLMSGLLCLVITVYAWSRGRIVRNYVSHIMPWAFGLITVSEFIFSIFPQGHLFWYLGHLSRVIGIGMLSWVFLKYPRLRFVDKMQVVLRGLVLLTVMMVIMPMAVLILYNVQQISIQTVARDSKSIQDYLEKDKQQVLSASQIISGNQYVINVFSKTNKKKTVSVDEIHQILIETGMSFAIFVDQYGVVVNGLSSDGRELDTVSIEPWLYERAFSGQNVVALVERFITNIDIVGAAPVYQNDKLVGIVLTGLTVDDSYFIKLKKNLQLDAYLFSNNSIIASSQPLTKKQRLDIAQDYLMSKILDKLYLSKEPLTDEITFLKQPFYISLVPVFGPQRNIQGAIMTGISADDYEFRKTEILILLIIIIVPVTLLAWWLGSRLSATLTRSIVSLGYAAKEVAHGNLDVKVPSESGDELSELSQIFNNMTEKLKEIDGLKSEYYSFMSHEIRTPLTALRGAAEALTQDSNVSLSTEQQKLLEIISQNAIRLNRLVDDFLQMAKLESGKISFQMRVVNLKDILIRCIDSYRPIISRKSIVLKINISDQPIELYGDNEWLYQVFGNLLNNAVKFTPEYGSITVVMDSVFYDFIDDGLTIGQPAVRIQVIDTGSGIGKEDIVHIFDKYHQAHSNKLRMMGTGLGLPICKMIIEDGHHGKIMVESELDKGSSFSIYLPVDFRKILVSGATD